MKIIHQISSFFLHLNTVRVLHAVAMALRPASNVLPQPWPLRSTRWPWPSRPIPWYLCVLSNSHYVGLNFCVVFDTSIMTGGLN